MKRRFLVSLLACLALLFGSLGLIACNDNTASGTSGNEHSNSSEKVEIPTASGNENNGQSNSDEKVEIPTTSGNENNGQSNSDEKVEIPTTSGNENNGQSNSDEKVEIPIVYGTQGLEYEQIPGKKEYCVVGLGTATETDIVIPSHADGMLVTEIGENAFSGMQNPACEYLTSISIPDGVTSIGNSAFAYCSSLTSVTIGNRVKNIGSMAFYWCHLTNLTIPDSVIYIGFDALACAELQFNKKDGLEYLGNSDNPYLYLAGVESRSITSATIDSNCRLIGYDAFYCCENLTSITIPDSVTSIGWRAFSACDSLRYNKKDGLKYLGNSNNPYLYLADVESRSIKSATIDSNCRLIGEDTFYNCYNLTSITIPHSVTSIGVGAFGECRNLTSITIPHSVTSIGNYAFSGCRSLTSIIIPDSVTSIGRYAFENCSWSLHIYCEATSKPSGWSSDFDLILNHWIEGYYDINGNCILAPYNDPYIAEVTWGYKAEE